MGELGIYVEYTSRIIEVVGVLTILVGTVLSLARFIVARKNKNKLSYKLLRQELGKGILLGLEILVAADIIATVVTEPTMNKVLTLGVIVLIRTFLSLSIELEIEGKFPWQRNPKENRLD